LLLLLLLLPLLFSCHPSPQAEDLLSWLPLPLSLPFLLSSRRDLLSHLPLPVLVACSLHPKPRIVISTEAAHAVCEQRSGEIRFSTGALPEATHSNAVPIAPIYFSSFSAQKSHVKP
jgi:hypothetical protein